jgi:hypothetical protein
MVRDGGGGLALGFMGGEPARRSASPPCDCGAAGLGIWFFWVERERERAAVVGEAGGRRRWTFYMWREGEGGRGMTCGARMAASVENGRCSSPRR